MAAAAEPPVSASSVALVPAAEIAAGAKASAPSNPSAAAGDAAAGDDAAADAGDASFLSAYVKSIVFGGLDGIVTTFAIVASVVGANLPIEAVLITGFAKLLGDGLSMGLGDCISEQAEQAHVLAERAREEWEYDNYAEGEVSEMEAIYRAKGFSDEDARRVIFLMTRADRRAEYKAFFIDHMMRQELGHEVPSPDDNPLKDGAATFLSFLFWGSIPLWTYVIFYGANYKSSSGMFGICIAVTLLCLYGLGAQQAAILKQGQVKQGLLMAANGGVAAAASYLVGWGLQKAVTQHSNC